MKFQVLKCTLKPETPNQTFVNYERRSHGVEFEIRKPGEGVQKNVAKLCNVVVVEMTAPDEVETSELKKKSVKHDPELLQFAMDSWDLAVELEEVIEGLTKELKIFTESETEAVEEVVKDPIESVVVKPKTRKRKAK